MNTPAETASCVISSPIGPIRLAENESGLVAVEFTDRAPTDTPVGRTLPEAARQLSEYFDGSRRTFELPLSMSGTPFQLSVWNALAEIPYGQTLCYADIARRVGRPGGSRAVGQANGANRLCIVVPCHRVIASDGSLGGYSAGLERKRFLLALERGRS